MKKFVYISFLFQFYCMSIVAGESTNNSITLNNPSTQPVGFGDVFKQSVSSQNLFDVGSKYPHADSSHQANNNNNNHFYLGTKDNFVTGEPLKKEGLFDYGSKYPQTDSSHQVNNNNNHLRLGIKNNFVADEQLKEKHSLKPLELQSSFWENTSIPQSPWSMNENNDVYEQTNLFRNEEINRLKILQAEALIMFSEFVSPGFNQKDYVENRVLDMSPDQLLDSLVALGNNNQAYDGLSSSVMLGKNNQKDTMESPTPSCCSEVEEALDFTKE